MFKLIGAAFVVAATPLLALFGLVTIAASSSSGTASAGNAVFDPSTEATADIPPLLLHLYRTSASACPGLPWQILAAIGKVESNHARYGGATTSLDGSIQPRIIGIPLDGTNGTARIPDTDSGRLDGDTVWDRAVGPFQFIPSSWMIFGQDGNGDGFRDPNNVYDAVPAAVAHLCPGGAVTDIETAVFGYNRSRDYVDAVLGWADLYAGALAFFGQPVAGYAFPAPSAYATVAVATRPHHDYPALDIAMPVGTAVYAAADGTVATAIGNAGTYSPDTGNPCGNTVVITGTDGATYTYCHLSEVAVEPGDITVAGQPIGLSGGEPGTPGAGNTTGPHLHYSVKAYGRPVCPQPLLLAIINGTPIPPTAAPATGCSYPGPSTDWTGWLDQALTNTGTVRDR